MLYHLAALVPIHFIKVIDVCQDILKVSTLVALTKILSTFTIDNRVDRGTPPLLYDRERSLILRLVACEEAAPQMSFVPEVERRSIGRWVSVLDSRSAGLLFKSKP